VTIGLNKKGGMDMEEFAKYLRNSIMPLYLNAAPEFRKWVILKCDSGPGRLNLDLLADLLLDGFILFPGVSNTTAVSQETKIMVRLRLNIARILTRWWTSD